jgi:hypothetical protein
VRDARNAEDQKAAAADDERGTVIVAEMPTLQMKPSQMSQLLKA